MEITIEEIKILVGQLVIENAILAKKLAKAYELLADKNGADQMKNYKQMEPLKKIPAD